MPKDVSEASTLYMIHRDNIHGNTDWGSLKSTSISISKHIFLLVSKKYNISSLYQIVFLFII